MTRKVEAARGQRRVWVEGQKSREQRQDLRQEGPGWTELLRGLPGGRVGTWQVQGPELNPGNKGVRSGAGWG